MITATFDDTVSAWLASDEAKPPLLLASDNVPALEAAVTLASLLVACQNKQQGQPCRTCAGCRQALAGNHPDIDIVVTDTATIAVKEIRGLLEKIHQHAFHGRRLVVIPQAQRVSPPAAAALLKTLEEPAGDTRWLLTTSNARRMLPTILSRCEVMKRTSQQAPTQAATTWPSFKDAAETLSEEELEAISRFLDTRLKAEGTTPPLMRSYMRLRDYYKIRSKRGNEKLAGGVLLATLDELRK